MLRKFSLERPLSFPGQNDCDPVLAVYLPYNMTEMNRQDPKKPCVLPARRWIDFLHRWLQEVR